MRTHILYVFERFRIRDSDNAPAALGLRVVTLFVRHARVHFQRSHSHDADKISGFPRFI